MTTHLDDLGLRAVEGEGGGGDPELAEVDAGEPRGGGRAGDVVDDESVDEEGLPDDLDLRVELLVEILAEEEHVAEEEGVDVHLR